MSDKKQQWKQYGKDVTVYAALWKRYAQDVRKHIASMNAEGETTIDPPKPPIENPPPPPNP